MLLSLHKKVILFAICLTLIFSFFSFRSTFSYASNAELKFDDTNVLDDLKSANGFNIIDYPFDGSGVVKHPEIISVIEYCYSFKVNMQSNYGLYLYFYNPQALDIKTDSLSNRVNMAVSYNTNSDGYVVPTSYEYFDLQYCSVSVEPKYYKLFYKYKVIDHIGADGKTILQRVNSNGRRYDISGVELHTNGETTATEYTVGGTYTFSGYAKGYGADVTAESDLTCDVRNLETISIDLVGKTDGVDKRTYWRSNSSSLGKHHQNQLNSVFFAIDKNVLSKFGYILQKIKAEWWEYKTRPTVVIDSLDIYNSLLNYNGVKISETYDRSRGWTLYNKDFDYISNGSTGGVSTYNWSWNAELKTGLSSYFSKDIETLLPLLFYTDGINVDDYTLLPETLYSYLENYNKSYDKGSVQIKDRQFSADLFADNVDNGRVKGYNLREFDIAKPGDYWNIGSYDSTHNWWDKICDYGFGSINTKDDYPDVLPIQMIKPDDIAVADISNHLKINPNDVNTFKNYYNSVKAKNEVFIFRYAQTDYLAEDLSIFEIDQNDYGGTHYYGVGEVRQGTQFFDFDILEFTFNKDGVYTVIPVVCSPIDHISGYTPSIEAEGRNWLKLILMIVLFVVLLIILMPLMPLIIQFIVWLIKLIFNILAFPFKLIVKAVKKNKSKGGG